MKLSVLCLLLMSLFFGAAAQNELPKGYYVVVAAFKSNREAYAKKYADQLRAKGHESGYGLSGKFFMVYIHADNERQESLAQMRSTRKKGEFPDAWTRVVKDGTDAPVSTVSNPAEVKQDEKVIAPPQPKAEASPTEEQKPVVEQPVKPAEPEEKKPTETVPAQDPTPPISSAPQEKAPVEIEQILPAENTRVFLNLTYATKNEPVMGEVQVIDTERARLIQKAKGNDYFILPDPKSKSDQLTLIADVFGYRKVQHELKYPIQLKDSLPDFVSPGDSALVITFSLIRYHRGDIQTLYHVYFYNDAVIMLPESKYELNSLVQMMQENPDYRIRLHGHSNGNHSGKILALGPDKNFFDMEGTVQGQGSAKDLSGQRAGVIKEYLVTNGIAADRIEVKAWGGKKPIYDKHSVDAKKNVRVEVEILND